MAEAVEEEEVAEDVEDVSTRRRGRKVGARRTRRRAGLPRRNRGSMRRRKSADAAEKIEKSVVFQIGFILVFGKAAQLTALLTMLSRTALVLGCLLGGVAHGCTNLLVSKGASEDGSTQIAYNADSGK